MRRCRRWEDVNNKVKTEGKIEENGFMKMLKENIEENKPGKLASLTIMH